MIAAEEDRRTVDDPRHRVLALLRRHGYNATSFQVLERGFRYWFDGDDACVAYADTGRGWVVAGAPIARVDHLADVARRFEAEAGRAGRRACWFAVESRMLDAHGGRSLAIGTQPVWNPADWPATLKASSSLREQVRRARSKGVRVRRATLAEIDDATSATRLAVEDLVTRWLASRAMAPMGFLVDVQPFEFAAERRYYLAECGAKLVGFLAAVPVYERGGWFFEDLLRDASAPNGTSESLVDAAMRDVAGAGSTYVTLGLAPLSGPIDPRLRTVSDLSAGLYDFAGLQAYKSRLRPAYWEPLHLVCAPGTHPALALLDALTAFARGSLARYGMQTFLRGPALVVRLLAGALVPWTAMLAALDVATWFPSAAVKWAWIVFDLALAAGLAELSRRWNHALATALATAVTADAVVTAMEALVFNVPRVHSVAQGAGVAVACAAPAAAGAVLWEARALRRKWLHGERRA